MTDIITQATDIVNAAEIEDTLRTIDRLMGLLTDDYRNKKEEYLCQMEKLIKLKEKLSGEVTNGQ
jgi:hypothetical protein